MFEKSLGSSFGWKKLVWSKFRSHFKCIGNYEKNLEDYLVDELNVNEEYMATHRTNSYQEMLDKVEAQLRRKSLDRLTSSPSLSQHTHLYEFVLEPRQETLVSMIEGSNLHPLIIAYFQSSSEACNTCELLLRSVHQVCTNYKMIQNVIKQTNGINENTSFTNSQFCGIFDELASFSTLNNPMMKIQPAQFRDIHNRHEYLLQNLTTKCRHTRRKATLTRYSSRVIAYTFGLVKKSKFKTKELKTSLNDQLEAELEVAAKGVFILINEFDTMSQLVKRLQDEIEHIKTIADMGVKNDKNEVLVFEVVKEFQIHQTCFLEQLEELKEHIYLCFLTINRSRTLVLQELVVLQED